MSGAFDKAWAATGRAEAGYVNHPDDPGGETNHGITVAVARAHGYVGPMLDLPAAIARSIAKLAYWDVILGDSLALHSEAVALEVFDTHFNFWPGAAGKFLQVALNGLNRQAKDFPDLLEDGKIGPTTVSALGSYMTARAAQDGEVVLLRALNCQQGADYLRQAKANPGKESFVFGWFRHRVKI